MVVYDLQVDVVDVDFLCNLKTTQKILDPRKSLVVIPFYNTYVLN